MKLDVSAAQARELARLRAFAPSTRCVVIGAVAVVQYVALPRSTGDIDLVLDLGPEELGALLADLGWQQDSKLKQRWRGPDNFVADALPASEGLIAQGFVRLEEGDKTLSLQGFDLLFERAIEVELPGTPETVLVAAWPPSSS